MTHVGRRIDDVDNELERAVCESLYRSWPQKTRRWGLTLLLGLKHTLRGLLFSWPLYLLGFAALSLPQTNSVWLALFLLPGVAVSVFILRRGIAEDYRHYLYRVLLKPGAGWHILRLGFN